MNDLTSRKLSLGTSPDLRANTGGIRTPNPFRLASAPPTNSGGQIMRAFDAGWGGAVWKTLGTPIQNVSSRFGGLHYKGTKAIGFNNIELITDRPLETNFREIYEVKKRYPKHGVIVSLMVESREEWRDIIKRSIDAGADGLELNFGCPHGMCERGMGSAVGQEPSLNERITSWAVEFSTVPVLVKLTPNVDEIGPHGLAAQAGGAQGVSLINTIKSIIGVDIERKVLEPRVGSRSTNGGYCGPAVKPIALHMIASLARDPAFKLPISGIGGVSNWRDAVELILLGCSSVQVCTEVMLRGYRVVEDMIGGLTQYMRDHGYANLDAMRGRAVASDSQCRDRVRLHAEAPRARDLQHAAAPRGRRPRRLDHALVTAARRVTGCSGASRPRLKPDSPTPNTGIAAAGLRQERRAMATGATIQRVRSGGMLALAWWPRRPPRRP